MVLSASCSPHPIKDHHRVIKPWYPCLTSGPGQGAILLSVPGGAAEPSMSLCQILTSPLPNLSSFPSLLWQMTPKALPHKVPAWSPSLSLSRQAFWSPQLMAHLCKMDHGCRLKPPQTHTCKAQPLVILNYYLSQMYYTNMKKNSNKILEINVENRKGNLTFHLKGQYTYIHGQFSEALDSRMESRLLHSPTDLSSLNFHSPKCGA